MPLLSYSAITDYPFQPFTKIFSADINLMFSTIQTLLNTTKLDSTNIQTNGLQRAGSNSVLTTDTANAVVINDNNGNLTSEAQLATSRGGLGFAPALGPSAANQVISVNASGTGFQLGPVPSPAGNVYAFYRFN